VIAPGSLPSPKLLEWRTESRIFPDYSGGTMPDLHRLPFYALAGTQDFRSVFTLAQIASEGNLRSFSVPAIQGLRCPLWTQVLSTKRLGDTFVC
jgi:hypothetical protein